MAEAFHELNARSVKFDAKRSGKDLSEPIAETVYLAGRPAGAVLRKKDPKRNLRLRKEWTIGDSNP